MTMVVTQPCIGCKHKSCLIPCPVECFHEDDEMLYIDPDECTMCGACIIECPVEAIFSIDEVPQDWQSFIDLNAKKSKTTPKAV